jgi:hypothetical protein
MLPRVLAVAQKLEVVGVVVEGVTVLMMNMLRAKKGAAYHLAHNVPMLPNPSRGALGDLDSSIKLATAGVESAVAYGSAVWGYLSIFLLVFLAGAIRGVVRVAFESAVIDVGSAQAAAAARAFLNFVWLEPHKAFYACELETSSA